MISVLHGDVKYTKLSSSKKRWLKNRSGLSSWKKLEKKLTALKDSAKPKRHKRAMSLSEDWLPCRLQSSREKVR